MIKLLNFVKNRKIKLPNDDYQILFIPLKLYLFILYQYDK